jgi:hypothetical protein
MRTTTMKTNDSLDLSPAERALVATGQEAMDAMKKRFEHWVDIGRALQMINTKTEGNRLRFKTMREEAGFHEIAPAVVTRLLKVMSDLDAVEKWRAGLTANQRFAWCSPSAIVRHCPVFNKAKAPTEAKLSPYAKLEQEHAVALEKLHRLERQAPAISIRRGMPTRHYFRPIRMVPSPS